MTTAVIGHNLFHLGVPVLRSAHPNVAEESPKDNARYYLITQQLDDENLGVNPQPITVRRVRLKLLLFFRPNTVVVDVPYYLEQVS